MNSIVIRKVIVYFTLIISVFLLIYYSWVSVKKIGTINPGFSFYDDGYLPGLVHSKWSGTIAGLKKGDKILSYDGVSFRSRKEFKAYLENKNPDPSGSLLYVYYQVQREENILTFSILPMVYSQDDFILIDFSNLLIGVLFLTGAFLFFLRPNLTSIFVFYLNLWSTSLTHFAVIDFYADKTLLLVSILGLGCLITTCALIGAYVHEESIFIKKRPGFFWLISSLFILTCGGAYFFIQSRAWPVKSLVDTLYTLLYISLFATLFISIYIWATTTSKMLRKRMLILSPAFVIGLLPAHLYYLGREYFDWHLPYELTLSHLLYLLIYLVAIIWINPVELSLRLKRTWIQWIGGFILMFFVALHLIYLPPMVRKYGISTIDFQWFFFAYIFIVMAGIIYFVQTHLLDRLFFRSTYYLPQIFKKAHDSIFKCVSHAEIIEVIKSCFKKDLNIERTYFYFSKQLSGDFYLQDNRNDDDHVLKTLPKIIPFQGDIFNEMGFIQKAFAGSNSEMVVGHFLKQDWAELIMPVYSDNNIMGMVFFAAKTNTMPYTPEDIGNIKLILDTMSLALTNARNYEVIKELEEKLRQENKVLKEEIYRKNFNEEIIGKESGLKEIFNRIEMLRPNLSTVLLRGESGTGKEVIARAIHTSSIRALGPFIGINCSAIPDNLLESELFGHEKGAFTGANSRKIGLFEMANQGTLFLDEIGDIPLNLQVKLLRAIQEREIRRVGGDAVISIDVRIIAATNKNLEEAILKKKFREDLYYRLNVVPIFISPLRDRKDDIENFVCFFVKKFSQQMNKKVIFPNRATLQTLKNYTWPGNVRELQNVIERAVALCQENTSIQIDHLEADFSSPQDTEFDKIFYFPDYRSQVDECQKKIITHALERAKGNKAQAARNLGIHVTHLHKLYKELFKTA